MTPLVKPVRRVVRSAESQLVVNLTPEGLYIRVLGQRKRYPPLSYGWLLLQAAKLQVEEERRAKRRRVRP